MQQATLTLDTHARIGQVDRRLAGQFIEVHRDCIYGGIYQPGHPRSNEAGFRQDLIDELRALRVPMIRLPGGNYCSNYHWKNGIGPVGQRPRRPEMAWGGVDTNEVGTDEYLAWAEACGMEAALTTNMGTGTPEEAAEWVEYCNLPGGTYYSDLRRSYGREQPYGVKTWYVGNEMDGPWQIGNLTAEQYAQKALHAARMMRDVDPAIELALCGSCTPDSPTVMDWDRIVLEATYDVCDYLSIHSYYPYPGEAQRNDYLASFRKMDDFIVQILAACDYVAAKRHSRRRMALAFDEWAVQCETRPRPEEHRYHPGLIDVLAVGGLWCTLLKHADRVKIGGQTMLVNALSVLFTTEGGVLRSGYYDLLDQVIRLGQGTALRPEVSCGRLPCETMEDVPLLETAAVWQEEAGTVTVFALNTAAETMEVALRLYGLGRCRLVEHTVVTDTEFHLPNTEAQPDRLRPRPLDSAAGYAQSGVVCLPPYSWNCLRFQGEARQ